MMPELRGYEARVGINWIIFFFGRIMYGSFWVYTVYTVYMYYVYRFINRMGFDQRKFQAQKATDSLVVFGINHQIFLAPILT
jgi:hypothetical protein